MAFSMFIAAPAKCRRLLPRRNGQELTEIGIFFAGSLSRDRECKSGHMGRGVSQPIMRNSPNRTRTQEAKERNDPNLKT